MGRKSLFRLGTNPALLRKVVVLSLLVKQDDVFAWLVKLTLLEQFASDNLTTLGKNRYF